MELLVLDVDGVMTDGTFLYSDKGKEYKRFGPDDADGLIFIKEFIQICFVTADRKGFGISEKRISKDMGYELNLVESDDRVEWISKRAELEKVIYMGDGFHDHKIFNEVGYAICTNDSLNHIKEASNFVTSCAGANRAVAEACLHIKEKFFNDAPKC